MNDRLLAYLSGGSALASITMQHVSAFVSILAGLCAVAAAVPIIVDRYRHLLPARITRYFPTKPAATP